MKLTKSKLQQMIKEELGGLREVDESREGWKVGDLLEIHTYLAPLSYGREMQWKTDIAKYTPGIDPELGDDGDAPFSELGVHFIAEIKKM